MTRFSATIAAVVISIIPSVLANSVNNETPFVIVLSSGEELIGCNPKYHVAPAKMFTFERCESIFINGFE